MSSTMSLSQGSLEIRARSLRLSVSEAIHVAEGVLSLTLVDPDGHRLPDWSPGAHIDLVLPGGLIRQYSLCGDRWDAYSYRIAVQRDPASRGGSAYIHEGIRQGDLVAVSWPRNNFRLVPSPRYVFVAGGIGITPLVPMIQQAEYVGADWKLHYLGRRRETMAFADDLTAAFGPKASILAKTETGPCDLAQLIGEARPDTKVYGCGPKRLLSDLERHCAPWRPGQLRLEHFAAKDHGAPARNSAFDVELARSGITVRVDPGDNMVDVIRRTGIPLLTSCRAGTCGTCEVSVLGGIPDHKDSILDDSERQRGDCMFPCVSRSRTDSLVIDL